MEVGFDYGLIIETDSYAGNFEREMCAYVVGHIGDCEVGEDEMNEYLEKYNYGLDGVESKAMKHETLERPVAIYCTELCPRNQALLIHFDMDISELTEDEINIIKERAHEYGERIGVKVIGFKSVRFETTRVMDKI